jgi:hypothetical protein
VLPVDVEAARRAGSCEREGPSWGKFSAFLPRIDDRRIQKVSALLPRIDDRRILIKKLI